MVMVDEPMFKNAKDEWGIIHKSGDRTSLAYST